jgi:multidrug transporter EmrE-like cation transporter
MTKYVLFLVLAVLFNTGSHVFFKYSSLSGMQKSSVVGLIAAGMLVGAVNIIFYARSLVGIKMNVAYPAFNATSIVLVTLISVFFFAESVTVARIVGLGLIGLGVVLVVL